MTERLILLAPPRFAITFVGSIRAVRSRYLLTPNALAYHLNRLMMGDPVSLPELESFGLRVHIEWDPDDWPTIGQPDSAASGAKR